MGWLIRLDEMPDENAMRIACRALVRRHVGLRAVPYRIAGDEAAANMCPTLLFKEKSKLFKALKSGFEA